MVLTYNLVVANSQEDSTLRMFPLINSPSFNLIDETSTMNNHETIFSSSSFNWTRSHFCMSDVQENEQISMTNELPCESNGWDDKVNVWQILGSVR